MDFTALRSIRRGEPDNSRQSAAEVVGNVNPCTILDSTCGQVAEVARDSAAAVVALMRNASNRELGRGSDEEAKNLWEAFDAGLLAVQAQLARGSVSSQVFQTQLLSTLQRGDPLLCEETGTGRRRGGECPPVPLALYWRLHKLALLPLSRLLEAKELLPSPGDLGQHRSCEDQRRFFGGLHGDYLEAIVEDMRALAARSSGNEDRGDSRRGEAAALVSEVATHLFDLAYREGPSRSGGPADGINTTGALASRAARTVLDRLCCDAKVFGANSRMKGQESRLHGCLSVLAAISPVATPAVPRGPGSAAAALEDETAGAAARDGGACTVTGVPIGQDVSTAAFLSRQLRLLMENSSGQIEHAQGGDAGVLEAAETADVRDGAISGLLAAILRHFPSAHIIEALRSICREAADKAADAAGWRLHKPLLRWETLGPVVRAAATAHADEVPAAVAEIGTELAAAAVNAVPSGNSRPTGLNQQQGVLVLSAAFRLVAEADVCSRGGTHKRAAEGGGLYAQWVRSCLGVVGGAAKVFDQAEAMPAPQEGTRASESHGERPQLSCLEVVQEAMKKQRASEVLMETLCLSVPYDPVFVLEVHKDVLITRLRASFSVQVRDFIDLVVTRLSDLNGRGGAQRRREGGEGRQRTRGAEGSCKRDLALAGRDCGDPTTREARTSLPLQIDHVGFFLRQFKQSGKVPEALRSLIVFQPKSWARIRKVLLAPPAERIAMPDDSGRILPPDSAVVKEAIGSGEGGLRVEVSLKYRRLLVQKLAKSSLITAQEHESFRNSYVEYLQSQRHQDEAESSGLEAAATGVVGQLVLLESKLNDRGSAKIDDGNDGSSAVEERLALLLQEFLPRALVVELCMEDEGEAGGHNPDSRPDRAWFSRATQLLRQILDQWKRQRFPAGGREGDSPGLGASPEAVAEAILNSVHCCVAAVGASLVIPTSGKPGLAKRQQDLDRNVGAEGVVGEAGVGMTNEGGPSGPLGVPVAQAFRRIGEVVGVAAGLEQLGDALLRRCSSLLAKPNRLDPKQLLSLTHSLAGLPAAFYPKVEGFLASFVAKVFLSRSNACRGGHVKSAVRRTAGLAATSRVGALYLQSSLLLHEHLWEKSTADIISEEATAGVPERHNGRVGQRSSGPAREVGGGGGGHIEWVGPAPIALLELCWWMERRLSIELGRSNGSCPGGETAGLLRLLQSVMKHPLMERALQRAFGARGSTLPTLERLVALELAAASETGFVRPSTKLALLESVTLGRLVADDQADDAEGLPSDTLGADEAALASPQRGQKGAGRSAEEVLDVWKECAACLFGNPSLHDAAHRKVCLVSTASEVGDVRCASRDPGVCTWESYSHASWRNTGDNGAHVVGNLFSLEATAGSMLAAGLEQTGGARESKKRNQRSASLLFSEALVLLDRLRADAACPALVLIAEIAIPAIGATEGHEKAIQFLRLLWKEWFNQVRPFEYGAVQKLMRMALMWYGGRTDASQAAGVEHKDCPVKHMLEDLPILAAEMVRHWTRLRRTLQPVIGSSPAPAGPFGRDGWAFHLGNLQRFAKALFLDLASPIAEEATSRSVIKEQTSRIPLGPVKNSVQDKRKRGEAHAVIADQGYTAKDHKGRKVPTAAFPRGGLGTGLCQDQLRDASAALPHTSAQVLVGVFHAAAETRRRAQRPRGASSSPSVKTKRAKTAKGAPPDHDSAGYDGDTLLVEEIGLCGKGSSRAWVWRVLEPVYGPGLAEPAVSSLGVLLGTLVTELGSNRAPSACGVNGDSFGGVDRTDAFESLLGVSLAVALLGHAPHLVARLAEPPCLTPSSSNTGPIERLRRSLAVFEILRLLLEQVPGTPGVWLTVALSHYTAAVLTTMSENGQAVLALMNGRAWSDMVMFVHSRVGDTATEQLRRLPVALRLAAQEVDPILKQYL
ncbi:unnamed protein product [Ectocarpus sp. 12 AP-2014]